MGAQVDHSFEEIARFKASRTDRYVDDLSAMLEPNQRNRRARTAPGNGRM
jgi:hypothetical protein